MSTAVLGHIGKEAFKMMGAHDIMSDSDSSLIFRIKGSRNVSHIRIELNDVNLYKITFRKWNGRSLKMSLFSLVDDICGDSLVDTIRENTGLPISI